MANEERLTTLKHIDTLVCELYRLTDEEVEVVEG
jgi:hypothetical protein